MCTVTSKTCTHCLQHCRLQKLFRSQAAAGRRTGCIQPSRLHNGMGTLPPPTAQNCTSPRSSPFAQLRLLCMKSCECCRLWTSSLLLMERTPRSLPRGSTRTALSGLFKEMATRLCRMAGQECGVFKRENVAADAAAPHARALRHHSSLHRYLASTVNTLQHPCACHCCHKAYACCCADEIARAWRVQDGLGLSQVQGAFPLMRQSAAPSASKVLSASEAPYASARSRAEERFGSPGTVLHCHQYHTCHSVTRAVTLRPLTSDVCCFVVFALYSFEC